MVRRLKLIIKPIMVFIILILPLFSIHLLKQEDVTGKTADRWSKDRAASQINVYISEKEKYSTDDVLAFREKLEQKLMENDALKVNGNGRAWADCFSAQGTVNVNTGVSVTEFKAYGVSDDFFLFHPLELINGSYFTQDNLMDDLVLLDEDGAWQLFGSSDVAGMEILIDGVPHIISGVIKREDGLFQKAAGNNKATIYLSYSALVKHGNVSAITSYEVVMPNLTKNYAKKIVKELIDITPENKEIVENSGRYSLTALCRVIRDYGKRSMQTKDIIYPYWENNARGIEDACALSLFIFFIIFLMVLCFVLKKCIFYIRNNNENIKAKISICSRWLKRAAGGIKQKILHKEEKNNTCIDTIILDIGNVLAEFIPKEYLKHIGIEAGKIDAVCAAVMENDIWNEYDRGIISYTETLNQFISQNPELEQDIRTAFCNLGGIVRKYSYTDKWIAELKESGFKVLYLSNISEKLYNDCLDELDFVQQMDGGILSFEAKMIKPEREIYKALIDKYNLKPESCVFIDDREVNIQGAKQAGFHTILFTSYEDVWRQIRKMQ